MANRTTVNEDHDLRDLILEIVDISLDATSILQWVADNIEPNRVYDADVLGEWALAHGYVEA